MRLIQEWLPPAFAPEEELEAREKLEAHLWSVCLARVRSDVPPNHWQVFEAHALHGRQSSEVARIFNTTSVNVRVIRTRVVAKIRAEWKNIASQQIEIPE
jgi:DNA-directed RNA polymerase specialized sigma24 family protein